MDSGESSKRKRSLSADDDEVEFLYSRPAKFRDRIPDIDAQADNYTSAIYPRNSRTRLGLPTPEASTLTESQLASSPEPDVVVDDTPKTPFPFMKLPAELRIHIYHMALVREEPLLLHADRGTPERYGENEMPPRPPEAVLRRVWFDRPDHHLHQFPFGRGESAELEPPPTIEPIVPELLRVNKQMYKEARQVLYSDNVFLLSLATGIYTLSTLHQRSRSLIKHVVLTIPSHHDILDGFADLVRLGLRYCWGLKTFKIILEASLPDDGKMTGATSVYANAFHILRWLPKGCDVGLDGHVSDSVKKVVAEEGRLQSELDEASYLKRQHQMPERH
ncbi:ENTH-like protein [Stemphylium lycopersici]|nr:hypothetical protein TW65_08309 [Stemphylium lycopersici]RAR09798.1 ENTH-like protein [Stemphylium lycopersici]